VLLTRSLHSFDFSAGIFLPAPISVMDFFSLPAPISVIDFVLPPRSDLGYLLRFDSSFSGARFAVQDYVHLDFCYIFVIFLLPVVDWFISANFCL